MNFSFPIKFSGLCVYSPNGRYFAMSKGVEAIIYETETLKVNQKFSFVDFISHFEWSPDSTLLLVGLFKRGICEVKSLDNPDWVCKIDEGLAGMSYARWAPDSRRIISICEFNVRMTIWSLIDRSTCYINYPKFHDKGLSFTSNGFFMALAERKDSKDYIGIYYTGDWSLVSHFPVDSYDLQDIIWSNDNTALVIWDSILECKFFVYSPTGNLIAAHEPYQLNLGIKSLNFSPNGHYLNVGFYDQTVRIYNHITWKLITDFSHLPSLSENHTNINIFKEEDCNENDGQKRTTKYIDVQPPVKIPTIKPALDKANPAIGIGESSWSFDSNYLATRNDNMPNTLWIWQISNLSLHTVIIQQKPIKNFQWSPTEHILLIVTENSKLYSFTLTNVYVVELVTDINYNLNVAKITWNSDGKSFLVSDKNYMIIGYPEICDQVEEGNNEEVYDEEVNEEEVDRNLTEREEENTDYNHRSRSDKN